MVFQVWMCIESTIGNCIVCLCRNRGLRGMQTIFDAWKIEQRNIQRSVNWSWWLRSLIRSKGERRVSPAEARTETEVESCMSWTIWNLDSRGSIDRPRSPKEKQKKKGILLLVSLRCYLLIVRLAWLSVASGLADFVDDVVAPFLLDAFLLFVEPDMFNLESGAVFFLGKNLLPVVVLVVVLRSKGSIK